MAQVSVVQESVRTALVQMVSASARMRMAPLAITAITAPMVPALSASVLPARPPSASAR
jgi:hypothetical protein